ncbi:hypothetical protein [Comamonas terrigena]|uniref:hypothetical protein n=1 Tax=Comamonas terrigena TaxID=32013 RepID=UPI002355234B|nr:hypothetical protein [Comamonas terrigena]
MRLQTDNYRFGSDLPALVKTLAQIFPRFAVQLNHLSEGRICGNHNAAEAPPSAGLYQAGDYVRNSAPAVLGAAGGQYVLKGWICVQSGEPGVWVEDRGVTGT